VPELTVRNFKQSLDFYTNLLGFRVRYARSEPSFAYLDCDGAQLMIEEMHNAGWETATLETPFGRGINITIEMADVSACYKRMLAAGWPLFRPICDKCYKSSENEESVMREFLLQDPDGYLLRPSQYLSTRVAGEEHPVK